MPRLSLPLPSKLLKTSFSPDTVLVRAFVLLGAVLRTAYLATGRSLWHDEAYLALNILKRTPLQLLQPLEYNQAAPPLFLWIEKFFSTLVNGIDISFRIFPFLASLLSLWLFSLITRRVGSRLIAILSLLFFAILPSLIRYSTEVKQYTVDVTICLLILYLALPLFDAPPARLNVVLLAVVGFISPWISHPSIFILSGVGITLLFHMLHCKDWRYFRVILWLVLIWIAGFTILYFLTLQAIQQNAILQSYWSDYFLPWNNPRRWLGLLREMLADPMGLSPFVLPLTTAALGVIHAFRYRWWIAFLLIFPFIITLIASGFQAYPFFGRFLLFLTPLFLILLANGIDLLFTLPVPYVRLTWLPRLVAVAWALMLIVVPVRQSVHNLMQPNLIRHIKPVLEQVQRNYQPGDSFYIYYGAYPTYLFYAPFYDLPTDNHVIYGASSRSHPLLYLEQIQPLHGSQRVWIIFDHIYQTSDLNEEKFIIRQLGGAAASLQNFHSLGASAYLFDLSSFPP